MKKILTITFIFFSFQTFAQGNLQFNQVLTYAETLIGSQSAGNIYTVPTNKVWKIKSISDHPLMNTGSNGGIYFYKGLMACINNKWIQLPTLKETFLKEGDTIKIGFFDESNRTSYNMGNLDYFISIVEFNIIP